MKAEQVRRREGASLAGVEGAVLVSDVRDAGGRVVLERGTLVGREEQAILASLPWDSLHVVRPEPGDVLEAEAGTRLVHAVAGHGVDAGRPAGGHWPLSARTRGVLEVRRDALMTVNTGGDLAVYTLPDGQVVDAGEVVARAKVIPFVVDGRVLDAGVAAAGPDGVVAVRPFAPARLGVVVQESLGSSALERFRRALEEKAAWLGASLLEPCVVARSPQSVAAAMQGALDGGARVVVVAGTMAMDPLDPAFDAIRLLRGRIERVGVPAHPGSLLWVARVGEAAVVGMPSCGLFSRATVFDLVLPRLLAGLPVDAAWLAGLGHGGLLTRDVAARFPPYRPRQERGAVD
jgi:molybdenum cofactor cytidylyltransferase